MNMNEYKGKRLIAAIAVFALIACAFVAFIPADGVDGALEKEAVSGAESLTDASTITTGKTYYVSTDLKEVTISESPDVTFILGPGGIIKFATGSTLTSVDIKAGTMEGTSIYAYGGLTFAAVAEVTYKGTADGGINVEGTVTQTEFGILVSTAQEKTYYPNGAVIGSTTPVALSADSDSVTVKNGTAYATASYNDGEAKTTTVTLVSNTTTTTGAVFTCDADAAPTLNSDITDGDVTIESGVATGTSGMAAGALNAYASGDVSSSAATLAADPKDITAGTALYVYGNVDSNKTATLTSGSVYFVDANATALSIKVGEVVYGTVTVNGTATFALTAASGSAPVTPAKLDLSGTLASPTSITMISGNFGTAAGFEIASGANVTVSSGATVYLGTTLTVNGTMSVSGALASTSTITVGDNGAFRAFSGAKIPGTITVNGTGTIDLNGVSGTRYVTGVTVGDEIYSQSQIVEIADYYDVDNNSTILIHGSLVVPEGTTLTIRSGSSVIVDGATSTVDIRGTVVVEENAIFDVQSSKNVDVYGSIQSEGTVDMTAGTLTIRNGGSVTIDAIGSIQVSSTNGFKVEANATLNIDGIIAGETNIDNKGTVIIDNENAAVEESDGTMTAATKANITINLTADGAVAEIRSISIDAGKILTIADTGSVLYKNGTTDVKVGDSGLTANTITITAASAGAGVFEGVTFTADVSSSTDAAGARTYTHIIDVAGNAKFTLYGTADAEKNVAMVIAGVKDPETAATPAIVAGVTVTDALVCGDYVNVSNTGKLTVSGEVSAVSEHSSLVNSGVIDVTGTITVLDGNALGTTINAAKYEYSEGTDDFIVYTTLPAAIDAVAAQTNKDVDIVGTITLAETDEIPSGVTVEVTTGAVLNIGSADDRGVTLTVASGAQLDNRGAVNVLGTLVVMNERTGLRGNDVVSDVYSTDGTVGTYTNIYNALSGLTSGEVTVTSTTAVVLTENLLVPVGVTLVVPANCGGIVINDGITMTVDGTLEIVNSTVTAQTDFAEEASVMDKTSAVVVNGAVKSVSEIQYDSTPDTPSTTAFAVPGAYYVVNETDGTYYYISPVAVAAENAADIQNGAVTLKGEISAGTVAFAGTEQTDIVITLDASADVDFVNLGLTWASINAVNGIFDGTVSSEAGSVTFANAKGFTVASSVASEQTVMSVTGQITKADNDSKTDLAVTIASGNVRVTGNLRVQTEDVTVASGATLTITGSANSANIDNLVVEGTLEVTNGGSITSVNLTVMGTATLGENTSAGAAAGKSSITNLFAGVSAEDTVNTLGSAAVVTGPFSAGTVYVAAEATVDEDVIAGKNSTGFYVSDALYMTVYVNASGSVPAVSTIAYPDTPGQAVMGWQYTDANGKVQDAAGQAIGAIERVDAKIETEVYKVVIKVDYGFVDVYVDGKLIGSTGMSGTSGEKYVMLTAGQHTVSYNLRNGYGGDIATSFNGTAFTGTFTIDSSLPFVKENMSFDDDAPYNNCISYELVLSGAVATGTTPSGGSDDGMGLTEILLVILVILIVVMAIMVALRLMRS